MMTKSQSNTPIQAFERNKFERIRPGKLQRTINYSFLFHHVSWSWFLFLTFHITFLHTVSKRDESERADRWSGGDRMIRSSTLATTPESVPAKSPDSMREPDENMYDSRRMPQDANRRPYGGIAVLPPILVSADKMKAKRSSVTQDVVPDKSPVVQKSPPTRERSARTPETAQKSPVTPDVRPTSRSKSPFSENLFESWDSKMQEVCLPLFFLLHLKCRVV